MTNSFDPHSALPGRETMEFDVVIVGAGPAGLSAAIRLKQKARHLTVVVVEKGAEVGAHILSGAVIDPSGIDALLPDWRNQHSPINTEVSEDIFRVLTSRHQFTIPGYLLPDIMSNHGNYVVSLGDVCRWLASEAEALGVEIYPGFAATELLFDTARRVTGVATGDVGIEKNGHAGPNHQRGMELRGQYTILAEGARGSLSKHAIARFELDKHAEPQKYGIGIKELWEVEPSRHKPGRVEHSVGWPLSFGTGGGSFLYHLENNRVVVGLVVHLNYKNPYLSPFEEFQRFKTHPAVRDVFMNGRRIGYGARAISEGGWQSVPKLAFPGGVLIGDSAGFMNLPRIKGSHNAVQSGILAAEHIAASLALGEKPEVLENLDDAWRNGPIGADLKPVRNVKPLWSRFGLLGVGLGGADMWLTKLLGRTPFGTLGHGKPDHACLQPASSHKPIKYPNADGVLTFDRMSSVFVSNTNHEENQPAHLEVLDMANQISLEHDVFDGPSTRYCPAGVYEWISGAQGPRLQINAQNCVHCKTCDIKDPGQNIVWTPPEGSGGPNYSAM